MSMRIGIVMKMIAPYTTPVFRAARRAAGLRHLRRPPDPYGAESALAIEAQPSLRAYGVAVVTFDLARLAVGAGFKTREDTYLYALKRPLAVLSRSRLTLSSRRVGDPGDDPRHMREPADPEDVKLGFRRSGSEATYLGYGSSTFWAVPVL
jgi:hypothetical protein